MKKSILSIMATTGVTLVILSTIAILYGGRFLFIKTIFEILLANIIIHYGLKLTGKFESKYVILESIVNISFILIVLISFGYIFDWYISTPLEILVIMAVVVYIIGCIIGSIYVKEDIKTINALIKIRKVKK